MHPQQVPISGGGVNSRMHLTKQEGGYSGIRLKLRSPQDASNLYKSGLDGFGVEGNEMGTYIRRMNMKGP